MTAAILVVASCSKPLPVAAVPEESKPSAAPLPRGKLSFVMSTSHEISCSQSFETHGTHVRYELSIDDSGHATLTARGSEGSTFGPSESKLGSPGSGVHHESRAIEERWTGSARATPNGVELELASDGKSWRLGCKHDRVEAQLPYGKAGASTRVEVLSCTPTRHVPMDDHEHIGALLFAPAPGLEHSVRDYGWGGDHVSLRLLE